MGTDGEDNTDGADNERSAAPASGAPGTSDTGDAGEASHEFAFGSYYELLGVPEDASIEAIERAYREAAKRHHPDRSELPEQAAERRFRQLVTARDVLTSVERRRAYDELGHEAYRRQSEALGEPVTAADEATVTGPEPRPEPDQAQRSARGEAHRRGDPVVTDVERAFHGPAGPTDESAGDSTHGRSVYGLVSQKRPESRSLGYVADRWARSWRTRVLVAIGSVLLVGTVLAVAPHLPAVADTGVSAPSATAGRLSLVGLLAAGVHTTVSCARAEMQLCRGGFLADRDHGRFAPVTARLYRRRGALALGVVVVLAAVSARNGVDPWRHATATVRGEHPTTSPWVGHTDWGTALDVGLSAVFVLAAVLGTLLVALGVSITLWRERYERGLRTRPSVWEPSLVAGASGTVVAVASGPTTLASASSLSGVPETAALAVGLDGAAVTPGTAAAAGVAVALVSVVLVWVRVGVAPDGTADPPTAE